GAIPEGTIDSELFGHEKGSFTGAHEARKGYFEVSNGGTIFLDEIGEMPLATQARLLRVLEYGEFIKVGSSKVLKTDARVVAATNINLLESVEKGKFRQDLYYRLNTVPIYVPALRERGSDIELLFRKFASDFSEKYKVKPLYLTEDAKIVLSKYRFPGNIRQLKNLVEQISVLEINREINNEKILKYLPAESNYLPALYKQEPDQDKSSMSERELLYKVLFDMRKDVNELKKLVHGMINEDSIDKNGMDSVDSDFFRKTSDSVVSNEIVGSPYMIDSSKEDYDFDNVEDISHETERDESLSIEAKEKELIIKALRKNNNKRKYAALDLGISERTLYRKIKQFEIDD
ncbi:UNVERIFIED_CONTAM: hypothetical protein GTU68_016402, partial [Idotea baltica]|nr:hypothetical protein [Idotea baltica]